MISKTAELYDLIYFHKNYSSEAAYISEIIKRHNPSASSLLDVACGTGRHLEFLSGQYSVEGIDLDPGVLEIARQRLPNVKFTEADMTEFVLGRKFHAVVCLFSGVAYVETVARLNQAVDSMAKHLTPEGILIVEPWVIPEAWRPGNVDAVFIEEPSLKLTRMARSEVRGGVSVLDIQYLIGTPDEIRHEREEHRLGLFSHEQYQAAFEGSGLTVIHDLEGLIGRGLYVGTKK
ncbi:MAG: class I SAM-dependent methyltransferase [Deltaproteobacteria bacterium]|nr:class I SAM-dependent methyltransferase [Deltaproteobacteria bacterium]